MTPADALRFLDHEAGFCRSRDEHEALCLLFPPLLTALCLKPMNGYEAGVFRRQLKQLLTQTKKEAAPWRRVPNYE